MDRPVVVRIFELSTPFFVIVSLFTIKLAFCCTSFFTTELQFAGRTSCSCILLPCVGKSTILSPFDLIKFKLTQTSNSLLCLKSPEDF